MRRNLQDNKSGLVSNWIDDLRQKLEADKQSYLTQWFPTHEVNGKEFRMLNPRRGDTSIGSFSLNLDNSVWTDFADGPDAKGNDLLGLYAYCFCGGNNKEGRVDAAKKLSPRKQSNKAPPRADKVYYYRDINSVEILKVLRYDAKDGKKKRFTQFDCVNQVAKRPTGEIPIYDTDIIHSIKNSDREFFVVVVEGEKSAEALKESLKTFQEKYVEAPMVIPTTWAGGTNQKAVLGADWSVLHGVQVILVPDDDMPGRKAMMTLGEHLKTFVGANGISVADVCLTEHGNSGADLADKDPYKEDFRSLIRAEMMKDDGKIVQLDNFRLRVAGKEQRELPDEEVETVAMIEGLQANDHFEALGMERIDEKVHYCLLSKAYTTTRGAKIGTGDIHRFKAGELNQLHFYQIAPSFFWDEHFIPKGSRRKVVDWKAVAECVMRLCDQRGFIDIGDMLRGQGIWRDTESTNISPVFVIHGGDQVYRKGLWQELTSLTSRDVFYRPERSIVLPNKEMEDDDILTGLREYIKIVRRLDWQNNISGILVGAWSILAPFCGSLDFRPHMYLSGTSGSGKSEVLKNIIEPMAGRGSLFMEGGTTEAGLRNAVNHRAIPILFDEGEKQVTQGDRGIEAILYLARSASVSNRAKIYHAAKQYKVKTMICLCAAELALTSQADQNRFFRATLRSPILSEKAEVVARKDKWRQVLLDLHEIGVGEDNYTLSDSAFWWTFERLPSLLRTGGVAEEINNYLSAKLERYTPRDGQRLAPLLGIAAMIYTGDLNLTPQQIHQFLSPMIEALAESIATERSESDIESFYTALFSLHIDFTYDGVRRSMSLGAIITETAENFGTVGEAELRERYLVILEQYGVKLAFPRTAKKDEWNPRNLNLYVAKTNSQLNKLFSQTKYGKGAWQTILINAGGSSMDGGIKMNGRSTSCIRLPLAEVINFDRKEDEDDDEIT